MYWDEWNKYSDNSLSPIGLCNLLEFEYQNEIRVSCTSIGKYLSTHPAIKELPLSVSELMQVIFSRLEDELTHLFLKESGIVFPCIRKKYHNAEHLTITFLDPKVFENIHNTHQLILDLTRKIHQMMNNYIIKPGWSKAWKNCVNEMVLLEKRILFCIQVEEVLLYPRVTGNRLSFFTDNQFPYYPN